MKNKVGSSWGNTLKIPSITFFHNILYKRPVVTSLLLNQTLPAFQIFLFIKLSRRCGFNLDTTLKCG